MTHNESGTYACIEEHGTRLITDLKNGTALLSYDFADQVRTPPGHAAKFYAPGAYNDMVKDHFGRLGRVVEDGAVPCRVLNVGHFLARERRRRSRSNHSGA